MRIWALVLGIAFGASGKALADLGRNANPGAGLAAVGGADGRGADVGQALSGLADGHTFAVRYENRWTRKGPKPPKVREVDLWEEEARFGPHTFDEHAEKTDQFLRQRIRDEPDLPAASASPQQGGGSTVCQ